MKEKYVDVDNIELFYYDNEKYAPALLFLHGNSMNSSLFYNQLADEKLNQYRLVAVDLPGHGRSAKSKDPENDYSVLSYIKTLIQFIKKVELNDLVVFGHSLGGHMAIHIGSQLKNDALKGLIIMGTPPLTVPPKIEEAFLPNPSMGLMFKPDLSEEDQNLLADNLIEHENNDYDKIQKSLSTCDPLVRAFIGKSIATELTDDESEIIRKAKFPVAVLHGESDQLVNPEYIQNLQLPLWNGQILIIKNSTHSAFLENPDHFNKIVLDFLSI